jgi:hypothetical protein
MADEDTSHLPEQVRRQIERANELSRELATEPGEGDQPTAEALLQDGTTVVEPRSEPRSEPLPVVDPSAAPPVAGEWEQRYRTLQGKYDSEIPQLRAQVQGLERLIATLQAAPSPASPAGPLQYDESDVDVYGQDFLDAAARAAAARYEPVIAELQAKLNRLEGGQTNLNAQSLENQMFGALDKDPELIGWRELNQDQRFIQWLQGLDEYAGIPRNDMLQHAYRNGDAMRVGRFFKRYMAEHTVPRPATTAPQTGYPARPNGNGQMVSAGGARLEDMVVPGRAAGPGGSGNGAQNSRIWSRAEITRFYRDRTAGKFRGREDEATRLEADLFAAEREGRIH